MHIHRYGIGIFLWSLPTSLFLNLNVRVLYVVFTSQPEEQTHYWSVSNIKLIVSATVVVFGLLKWLVSVKLRFK